MKKICISKSVKKLDYILEIPESLPERNVVCLLSPLWTAEVVDYEGEKFLFKCSIICLQKTWFSTFLELQNL